MSARYQLTVTYGGGFNDPLDALIESIAGERVSSGTDFVERDLQFDYPTEFEAKRIQKRLLTEVPTHPVAISVDGPYPVGVTA